MTKRARVEPQPQPLPERGVVREAVFVYADEEAMSNSDRERDPEAATMVAAMSEEGEKAEGEQGSSLLELLLGQAEGEAAGGVLASRIDGVVVGQVAKVEGGTPHVTFAGAPKEGFAARMVAPIGEGDVGSEVALMFEGGDPRKPIVMGKMVSPLAPAEGQTAAADGRRVEITAQQEIVLKCGDASITLTRAGKILIRGAYVLSRSTGTNRIQGGSVEIN